MRYRDSADRRDSARTACQIAPRTGGTRFAPARYRWRGKTRLPHRGSRPAQARGTARQSRCRRVLLDQIAPADACRHEPRTTCLGADLTKRERPQPIARREGRAGAGRPRPLEQGAHRAAGKRATRFRAASSVTVIRVDPTLRPAHRCAWHVPPTRIRTRRANERSESMSGDRFPALRKRAADGQCRCGPCKPRALQAETIQRSHGRATRVRRRRSSCRRRPGCRPSSHSPSPSDRR